MTEGSPTANAPRLGGGSALLLAALGAAAAFLLSRPAPESAGMSRLRDPEILLAVFDTVWLLVLALPGRGDWSGTAARLLVGAPFHWAVAAAAGAGPGFHAAFAISAGAFASVGTLGARLAPTAHGVAIALLSFALPLAAYAAGDFGGAGVRALFLASPTVGPTLLARSCATASASDAIPAVVAAALVLAACVVASRRTKAARS
jgi:hypothetical protein